MYNFTFLSAIFVSSSSFTSSPTLGVFTIFHSGSVYFYLTVVLIYISLMTNDVEHLLICLLAIWIYFVKCLFKSFVHFFYWLTVKSYNTTLGQPQKQSSFFTHVREHTINSVTFIIYLKLSFHEEKGHIYKDFLALDVFAYFASPEVFNWQWQANSGLQKCFIQPEF